MSQFNPEDNYLSPDHYLGHPIDVHGFARFTHPENGQFYFAYHQSGELILRSEGYLQESGRENGIASVKNYKDNDNNYRVQMQPDGQWVLGLWAANNKEIARSDRFPSESEARRRLPSALTVRSQMLTASNVESAREDDYLTCREYENQPRIPEHREFSLFEKNGEYYFGFMGDGDDVLLRSEGYKSEDGRVNGMQSVLRNKGDRERYKIEEKLGYYFVVLTAANRKEIARSCPKTHAGALALIDLLLGIIPVKVPVAPVAAAVPLAATAAAVAPPVIVKEQDSAGGIGWIWLLLIPILLLLLFCLWKGCKERAGASSVTTQVDTIKLDTQSTVITKTDTAASEKPKEPAARLDLCGWSPVHFGYGMDTAPDTARKHIQRVVDLLKSNSTYTATFVGNTDDKGSVEFNVKLARHRAETIKQMAIELGGDGARITVNENNEQNPAASNASEEGRTFNRRVEMYVYDANRNLVCKEVGDKVPAKLQVD